MTTDIQKMIDDAVEEFRKKLEKEFTELTGTQFECIDNNGELFVADAKELNSGTLIIVEDWEVFRILDTFERHTLERHTLTHSLLSLCVSSLSSRRLFT